MTMQNGGTGRDERFRTLYQKYYRRMVRYFIRAFRVSEEDAEELTQDAFVRFYQAMGEYRGEAEWAFFEVIAQRVALNRIRSFRTAKRNADVVDFDDPQNHREPAAPQGPDYAEEQEVALRRQALRRAIAEELSPGQRQCIQLWLAGYKYDEIARILRITVDAVKSRLRDAKKVLRARLGDAGALPEDEQ